MQQRAEEKKAARAEEEHRKRAAEKAAKQAAAAAYQDADWITAGEEEQLAKMDVQQKEEAQGEVGPYLCRFAWPQCHDQVEPRPL